jgi:hypothetical protein
MLKEWLNFRTKPYKVAFDATFWARHDLRFAAFQPTVLDYEAVHYLGWDLPAGALDRP